MPFKRERGDSTLGMILFIVGCILLAASLFGSSNWKMYLAVLVLGVVFVGLSQLLAPFKVNWEYLIRRTDLSTPQTTTREGGNEQPPQAGT